MAKKSTSGKTATEATATEATVPEVVVTKKPILVPPSGASVDAQLAADIDEDVVDEGGYGRRTPIAIQLLRTDRQKILAWLDRNLGELKDADARDELTKLRVYFGDRLDALETLVPQHKSSTRGTIHYSDEAWAETRAGAPVAEAVRTVGLTRLKSQPALRDQFSPRVELAASPQGLFDAVTQMITALSLPDKQALYQRKRIRAAKLVTLLTTVETRLGLALTEGVTDEPRTGEVSAAINAVLLQVATAAEHIEVEFTQELRPDLADAFAALIPHRHGSHKSDRQPSTNPPPQNPPPEPPPQSSSADQKPNTAAETPTTAADAKPSVPAGDAPAAHD